MSGRPDGDRVSVALLFLRAARERPELAERVRALDPAQGLDPVLAVAAEAGFPISAGTLRQAFAHDWALRRVRYVRGATSDSAVSTVAEVNSAESSR